MSEQQPGHPGPPPPAPAATPPATGETPVAVEQAPGTAQPPAPPWYPWPPAPVALPSHPRSTAALTLGIVAACGVVVGFTLVLGPLAWYYGATAMRDVDREPGRWGGRGNAKAGLVLGIVASALLVFALLVLAVVAGGITLLNGFDSGYPR